MNTGRSLEGRLGDMAEEQVALSHLKQFEPFPSPFDPFSNSHKVGISLNTAKGQSSHLLADIVKNIPIRLLAATEFVLLSKLKSNDRSPLAYLLRYHDFSEMTNCPNDYAQVVSHLSCLITDDYNQAKTALLLNIPTWLISFNENDIKNYERTLKKQWGDNVSIVLLKMDTSIGKAFLWIFLYKLLNEMEHSFIPFDGEYQIPTVDETVSFVCPPIQTADQIDFLLKQTLFPFKSVSIETTSICNLACDYCPNSKFERDKAFMQESTFYRIIDSISDYTPEFSGEIRPHMYGEPLIDNRLEDFIRYAKHRLPKIQLTIFTNGHFLTPERFLSLKQAGADLFHISQHSLTPLPQLSDTLAHIKANYPELYTVSYNVEYLAEYKMNRGGLIDVVSQPLQDKYYSRCASCRDLTFDVNGNAVLCCNDYFGRHTFGNIQNMSVQKIWEGAEYSTIRNMLFFGMLPVPMCQACMNITKSDC
jgi:organic radical activating enzyme